MVTKQYIDHIKSTARLWQPYDREQDEVALVQFLQAGLPDWNAAADNLLRRAVPLMVEYNRMRSETAHAQVLRSLLAFAEGEDLDVIGLGPPPVFRYVGEPDEDYRVRIANSQLGLSIGSLGSAESRARLALPALTDVLAVVAPNRQNVAVFALKGEHQQITTTERTSLEEFLQARDGVIAGVEITAPAPTFVEYSISVIARYDKSQTAVVLEPLIRSAIYAYLGQNHLGRPVYRSAINDAAHIPGVSDVVVLSPPHDLAPPELVISGGNPVLPARAAIRVAPYIGASGGIASITVTNGGSGYISGAPVVSISGGGGSGATATATVENGAVTAATITNPGSGYTTPPTVVFSHPNGSAAEATAVLGVFGAGPISALDILDAGEGYQSAPDVDLLAHTNLAGSGTTFTASINNDGEVSAIAFTGGEDYSAGPQYDFCPLYHCPATDAGVTIVMEAI